MVFTLSIPLQGKVKTRFDIAYILEEAAVQLRNSKVFGDPCSDGFTTQNIRIGHNLVETIVVGTYAVKGR